MRLYKIRNISLLSVLPLILALLLASFLLLQEMSSLQKSDSHKLTDRIHTLAVENSKSGEEGGPFYMSSGMETADYKAILRDMIDAHVLKVPVYEDTLVRAKFKKPSRERPLHVEIRIDDKLIEVNARYSRKREIVIKYLTNKRIHDSLPAALRTLS